MTFPVDDVTLAMLAAACEVSDDGRSHLFDFLDASDDKHSPHEVISALCAEIQRSRTEVDDESFNRGYELGYKHGEAAHLKEAEAERQKTSRDAQVVEFDDHDTQCEREWVTGSWGGAWSACGCAARRSGVAAPEGDDT